MWKRPSWQRLSRRSWGNWNQQIWRLDDGRTSMYKRNGRHIIMCFRCVYLYHRSATLHHQKGLTNTLPLLSPHSNCQ